MIKQYVIPGAKGLKDVKPIVMHKSIMSNVKIMCNDRIIALKMKAEPLGILFVQMYIWKTEYEDDKLEELYNIIKEILEEDRWGETNTTMMEDWESVVGCESYRNIVVPHALERRSQRVQMLIDFWTYHHQHMV